MEGSTRPSLVSFGKLCVLVMANPNGTYYLAFLLNIYTTVDEPVLPRKW